MNSVLASNATFWNGKRVFITGHSGFKGGWLTVWLESLGAKIGGYSLVPDYAPNLYTILDLPSRCEKNHVADIRDLIPLSVALHNFAPELVIHMAAQPLVRRSYAQPLETIAANTVGTANLLEACRGAQSVRAILIITSDKCYAETSHPHRENDALGGNDIYSASKAAADILTHAYRQSFFKIPIVTARSGNVIGGGDWSEDRLIPDAARAFSQHETLVIRAPESVRPWQHVVEPLQGYLMLARAMLTNHQPLSPAYNFGPGREPAQVEQVVRQFAQNWQPAGKWRTEPSGTPERKILALDSSLAQRELDWRPQLSLDETIAHTADWYRGYYAGRTPAELHKMMLSLFESIASAG